MRESLAQDKIIKALKRAGYVVWNLSDRFTHGVPDTYAAKDGVSHWYEIKVTNKKPGQTVDLDDRTSSEHGFTLSQKIKIYEQRKVGIDAWGLLYVAALKSAYYIPPEDFGRKVLVEDIPKIYREFDFENP